MYIFTINIAKDIEGVNVVNMAEPKSGCLHDYQMTPADMKLIEDADIMVINGAGMESFLDKITKELPDLKIVEASKELELLEEEENTHESEEEDVDHSNHEHSVNAHIWVSISGAIAEVKNIGEQLANADPDNAEKYRSNTSEYVLKLEKQKEKMIKALEGIENKNIVTFHEAFPYFAEEFGLNIVATIQSEEGSEPSAGEMAGTIRKIKESNVKALFTEPQNSSNAVDIVSRETGLDVYVLDPVVSGDEDDMDAYGKAMDENLRVLVEALK
ncbi:MAG: High-affinity zinc uptake system binding-protein ZnuA precursor [Firmicutes bacterium ADurb.Bin419]|nr:MAG: High-affinity zinc uptake system binding-protein ZnuA precursor [Firmicutes bacterium ADurb.Bin419]